MPAEFGDYSENDTKRVETVQLHILVPRSMKRDLKMLALEKEATMSEIVGRLIADHLYGVWDAE